MDFYFQKINLSSSSEGSTVNLALFEEKAETEPEKAAELQTCFTEGMKMKFEVSNCWKQAFAVQGSFFASAAPGPGLNLRM